MKYHVSKYESGQVLAFFIVAGTVVLAVVANLALRNISSVTRVSTSDTYSRVAAAAEGGLERFLAKSVDDLDDYVSQCAGLDVARSTPACQVSFTDAAAGDPIEAVAYMTVEEHGNDSTLDLKLEESALKEINLDGYGSSRVTICWNGDVAIYYNVYGDGNLEKGIVCDGSACDDIEGADSTSTLADCTDYDHGYSINFSGVADPLGLRLIALKGDTNLHAVGSSTFPVQGYKITSYGEIRNAGRVQATEKKSVIRSLPYLPAFFDFGVYGAQGVL